MSDAVVGRVNSKSGVSAWVAALLGAVVGALVGGVAPVVGGLLATAESTSCDGGTCTIFAVLGLLAAVPLAIGGGVVGGMTSYAAVKRGRRSAVLTFIGAGVAMMVLGLLLFSLVT